MNTKKLIGMIIGIAMFAALLAGATFAWLTFQATFTNNTVTGTSRDFTFTYNSGTAISNLVWSTATPTRNTITAGNGYIPLTVTKTKRTPEASSFKIILKKTTMEITVAGLVKYAVCRSDTATECNNAAATQIPAAASGVWVAVGTVASGTSTPQTLYDDTTTFNVYSETTDKTANYYVYFWLDSSVITTANSSGAEGKTIAGYVYAEAVQGENGTVQ